MYNPDKNENSHPQLIVVVCVCVLVWILISPQRPDLSSYDIVSIRF